MDWESFRAQFFTIFFNLELEKFDSDLQRLGAIFDVEFERIMDFDIYGLKSYKDSSNFNKLKVKGNYYLNQGESYSAAQAYTRALYTASTLEEKAIAFGNRSVPLLDLGLSKESLSDINASIKCDYPIARRFRLLNRAGQCHMLQNDRNQARKSFNEAIELLENHCDDENQKKLWRNRISEHLKKCDEEAKSSGDQPGPVTFECVRPSPPDVSGKPNSRILSASDAVEIKITEIDGRGLYATRDVGVGEYLAVETPYTCCVIPERYLTHCYRCMNRSMVLIPCRECSVVGYCSSTCEELAWTSFHQYECQVIDHLNVLPNLRMVRLAYRTVISTEKEEVLQVVSSFENKNPDTDENYNDTFDSSKYRYAYGIIANSSQRDREDMTERSILAVFLLLCAIKVGYVKKPRENKMEAAMIGAAFLRHLQSLPCNAHEINEEYIPHDGSLTGASLEEIASGLFPLLSLINHSCDPNIHRICFADGVCAVISLNPIRAGEQLYDCYSQHFAVISRNQRQLKLKEQYLFECRCAPCINDWPQYEALCDIVYPALCMPQLSDKDARAWQRAAEKRDEFMDLLDAGYKSFVGDGEAEKFFVTFQTLLARIVQRPWKEINNNEECLKILWNLKGNLFHDFR